MIRELKTFLAVAREGTFAAAGERIGLTQAAVSAQMQRLEAELGFALFDRTGRSARINAKGERTLARAEELMRLYERLGSAEGESSGTGLLTVGAIASAQRVLLPQAVARLRTQMPQCRVHVVPGVSLELLARVDGGEVEIATMIRPPFPIHGELRWTTLAQEPFRLLVPQRLRGADWAEMLATEPFIRYDRASFGGRQVERFLRGAHITVQDACELDELDAIVRLVAIGVGVALVPQPAGQSRWPPRVRALDLGRRTFHRDIGLLHREARSLSEPARVFRQAMVDVYREVSAPAS